MWDPYLNGGQPWLANPNCFALYPSRVLYFVLTPLAAFNWEIFLHHLLGTLGTYFLARRLRLSPAGAATAAAVWAFSGVSISIVHLGRFLGYHTLPFAALAAVEICRQQPLGPLVRGPHRWLLLADALGCGGTHSGDPALGGDDGHRSRVQLSRLGQPAVFDRDRPVSRHGFGRHSDRARGPFSETHGAGGSRGRQRGTLDWSFSALRIVEILIPGALGPLDVANPAAAYWGSQVVDQGVPLLLSVYGGAAAMLLALVALVVPSGDGIWRRLRWALLATIVLSGVAASAASIPFARSLFDAAPWLAVIRYPVKLLAVSVLPLALLAGWGVQRLTTEGTGFAKATAAVAAAAATVLAILAAGARVFPSCRGSERSDGYFDNRAPGMLEGVTAGLDHCRLALMGVLLSVGLVIRGSSRARTVSDRSVGCGGSGGGGITGLAHRAETRVRADAAVGGRDPVTPRWRDRCFGTPTRPEIVPPLPADRAWAPASWWSSVLDDHLATTWSIPTVFHPNTSSLVSNRWSACDCTFSSSGGLGGSDVLNAAGVSVILTPDEISDALVQLEEEFPISGEDVFGCTGWSRPRAAPGSSPRRRWSRAEKSRWPRSSVGVSTPARR